MRFFVDTALLAVAATIAGSSAAPPPPQTYKYVLAFSVDGMHGSDVTKYVAKRPKSTIASLLETGYEYTNAFTTGPSDSFPGSVAQFTGANPRTTGVWYDDTWVKNYYAPGTNCTGPAGAEVAYAENLDYNSTLLWSGGISVANLPLAMVKGVCTPIYPHAHLRVNTVFEVARAAGLQTAYADKHPSYDIMNGPSGTGLTVGYFPEIQSVNNTVNATIGYDKLHVQAWLDWIDGVSPANSTGALSGQMPALFGGNFQAVSVAQKTVGYNNDTSLSKGLLQALDFVDNSLGKIVEKLKSKKILHETLIIVASKHGQAPINRTLWNEVDPDALMNATGVPTAWITTDDIGLIYLNSSADTATAVKNLQGNATALKIKELIYGSELKANYGNPLTDPAVPDIIVRPELGTCYTTSKSKIAEHGGLSNDDRHVACFVSNPGLAKTVFSEEVATTMVGPTILKALGLKQSALKGAVVEGTKPLIGFRY